MTYKQIALASRDEQLRDRIAGCIATQDGYVNPPGTDLHPEHIATFIQWRCAGSPGWGEAYSYALETNVPDPGNDEGVITDAMILSAVQLILGIE